MTPAQEKASEHALDRGDRQAARLHNSEVILPPCQAARSTMEFKRPILRSIGLRLRKGATFLQHSLAFTDGNRAKGNGRAQRAHATREPLNALVGFSDFW